MTSTCCSPSKIWIFLLSMADIISDFVYFGELYRGDDVEKWVSYMVLGFAIFGLVAMIVGPPTRRGLAAAVLLEDFPMIITTTVIEAYVVGADVTEWTTEGIVSYGFSVFTLQQKLMHVGFAPARRGGHYDEDREKPGFCWVLLNSTAAAAIALAIAWTAAAFIILWP